MSQLTLVTWNVHGLNGPERSPGLASHLKVLLESLSGLSHEIWIAIQEHKISGPGVVANRAIHHLAPTNESRWAWADGTKGGTALIQYRKAPPTHVTCHSWNEPLDTAPAAWKGRWTRQHITWGEKQGYIRSVYAPCEPAQQAPFFKVLFETVGKVI